MVSLDPCLAAVKAAIDAQCTLLVTHHPLIFSPLKKISSQDGVGSVLVAAIQHNLSVVCAHTNYDAADGGLNDLLAARLGLSNCCPLGGRSTERLAKLVVFVPAGSEDAVRGALFSVALAMGNYDECSFAATGTGTFRPLAGSRPYSGVEGERSYVEESRLEFLLREADVPAAVKTLRRVHPYEEPAYDIYPLLNQGKSTGIGRLGVLAQPMALADAARMVRDELGCQAVRVVGHSERVIRKVAVCGGSGSFLVQDASFKGADLLVTGDVKYHEARTAEELGVALIDAGHFATEHIAIDGLASRISEGLAVRNLDAEVLTCSDERDPFVFV